MSSDKKEYELFLELLLMAERYSSDEIKELKAKLTNLALDEKIVNMLDMVINLKEVKIKKPLRKQLSPKSLKYESMALTELKRSDPDKYAILKPIEEELIKDESRIEFATLKELVLELGGSKKDAKSRRDAIRVLIRMLSRMNKEEIKKYVDKIYTERKEGRLDVLASFIMRDSNAII